MRVYFGGTFDPPHLAHSEIFQALLKDSWVDHIHFVPTNLNPFKTHSLLTVEVRRKCLDAFLKPFASQSERWTLEDLELKKPPETPSFTIDALKNLKSKYKDSQEWVLCVGSDTLFDFQKWKDVEDLKQQLHSLWVVPRGESWPKVAGVSQRILAGHFSSWSSTQVREAMKLKDLKTLERALSTDVINVLKEEKII